MTDVTDHIDTDVRERILVTAERLFREIGYQKTTVADIAKALQMSPANVYRFFDSKKSINAGVARRLMGEVEEASRAIAAGRGSAVERLRELLTTVHRMNSDRYVRDSKMHGCGHQQASAPTTGAARTVDVTSKQGPQAINRPVARTEFDVYPRQSVGDIAIERTQEERVLAPEGGIKAAT